MDKTIFKLIGLTVLLIAATFGAQPVKADLIAGSSAAVTYIEQNAVSMPSVQKMALKRKAMTEVLKRYNAPLLSEVDSFLEACVAYELDCYLLPSISGVESTFGRFLIDIAP